MKYLFLYNPQIFILLVLVLGVLAFQAWSVVRSGKVRFREGVRENYLFWVIVIWAVLHVGIYALTFRTLAHHLRYLSGIFPATILLAAYVLATVRKKWRFVGRRLLPFSMAAVLVVTVLNLSFWKEVYGKNIEQVEKVYVKAAEWIRKNTAPTDRIAAFDIGVVRYMTNREVVDLGGLVDPGVYPLLAIRSCGEYVREKNARYIIYSRFPDCDLFTGLYNMEYGFRRLMKESLVASFRTDYYRTPTITHSYELDIYRIEGWLRRDLEGVREQFTVKEAHCDFPVHHVYPGGVELIGYDLDRPEFTVVKGMAQAIYFTYYWRRTGVTSNPAFVRTTFRDPITHLEIIEKYHIPTHGIYPMYVWRPDEIVRERHLIWVPDAAPPGEYEIRINVMDDFPLDLMKWVRRGAVWTIKEIVGLDAAYFPKDETVNSDFQVGRFRVYPSVLETIRFKYKKVY